VRSFRQISAAACTVAALVSLPLAAQDQTVYVNDDLRIALRAGPGDEFRVVRILVAGTELAELERNEPWVRVSQPGGAEGWVQSRYISEEPPARVQMPRLLEAQERNRAIIERLEGQLAKLDNVTKEAAQLREATSTLSSENARLTYSERARDMLSGAGIALVGLLVGALWPRRSGMNSLATGKRVKL
jgi:SH3 domain protein